MGGDAGEADDLAPFVAPPRLDALPGVDFGCTDSRQHPWRVLWRLYRLMAEDGRTGVGMAPAWHGHGHGHALDPADSPTGSYPFWPCGADSGRHSVARDGGSARVRVAMPHVST